MAGNPQRVEDLAFEGLNEVIGRVLGFLAVGDSLAEPVDCAATGLHDGGMAVLIRGRTECGKVEQAVNSRDISVSVVHSGYSNPPVGAGTSREVPIIGTAPGRHWWS